MFVLEPAVDGDEYFAVTLHLLQQQMVRQSTPAQFQNCEYKVFRFQKPSNARIYTFIEDNPH